MQITGWTNWFDDNRYSELPQTEALDVEVRALIARELRDHDYKFTGDYHQHGDFGVPIIDGAWLYKCSQRKWGGIMADAYPDKIDNTDGYGYLQWAWDKPDGEIMVVPNKEDYK